MASSTAKNASRNLVKPIQVGAIPVGHRVALAPLTRFRADDNGVHQDSGIEYYTQRATVPGTLMFTEATFIRPEAGGYANVPGVWSDEQVAAWKKVTDAVHERKSFLFVQAWALGRAAKAEVLKKYGYDVVSSSDLPMKDGPKPRPLSLDEVKTYVQNYGVAAKNAQRAGFDGVEIHGANGYLIDQFLNENVNKRTDQYGGSRENRLRFAKEVIASTVEAYNGDASHVGIRLSPYGLFQLDPMDEPEMKATFTELAIWIKETYPKFAYIHVVEPRWADPSQRGDKLTKDLAFLRDAWGSDRAFVRSGYSGKDGIEDAFEVTDKEDHTLIAFGRTFIANPDLPDRIKFGTPLTDYDRSTFYGAGPQDRKGYTDYPFANDLPSSSLYNQTTRKTYHKTGIETD